MLQSSGTPDILGTFISLFSQQNISHLFIFMGRQQEGEGACSAWSALGEEGAACPLQLPAPSFPSWESAARPPCRSVFAALWGCWAALELQQPCSEVAEPSQQPAGATGPSLGGSWCSEDGASVQRPRGSAGINREKFGSGDGNLKSSDILWPFPKLPGVSQT